MSRKTTALVRLDVFAVIVVDRSNFFTQLFDLVDLVSQHLVAIRNKLQVATLPGHDQIVLATLPRPFGTEDPIVVNIYNKLVGKSST